MKCIVSTLSLDNPNACIIRVQNESGQPENDFARCRRLRSSALRLVRIARAVNLLLWPVEFKLAKIYTVLCCTACTTSYTAPTFPYRTASQALCLPCMVVLVCHSVILFSVAWFHFRFVRVKMGEGVIALWDEIGRH